LAPWFSLAVQSGRCGLMGDLFMALNGIRYAERNGLACSIDWRRSLYFDPAAGVDVWSALFCRQHFDFADRPSRFALGKLPYRPGAHVFEHYQGLTVRRSVHQALQRFCQVRPALLDQVATFAASRFSPQGTLGIHLRLTDAARGHESRQSIGLQDFLDDAGAWLGAHPGANLFLATDEQQALDCFRREFGDLVVFADCLRSADGTSLHGHYDGGVAGSPLRKAQEVLIDALLLARCSYLICAHSRVTCYSLCVSPDLEWTNLEVSKLGRDRTAWLGHRSVLPAALPRASVTVPTQSARTPI
jgi:hypothetical protein